MDSLQHRPRSPRGRGRGDGHGRGRGHGVVHRNKQWVNGGAVTGAANSGRGRGDVFANGSGSRDISKDRNGGTGTPSGIIPAPAPEDEPFLESAEEREKFYQELVKSRELERKHYIALGLMDDPLVPKRLSDAITLVGTCLDLCPRFERYRRERENNLFPWESMPPPNQKRVSHPHAVKAYERAAGDKTLPSDLRPPHILKKTLDYLFGTLVRKEGFKETFGFVRDRTRSVRNDFTMQHERASVAIECHERCARFHVVALHEMRGTRDFEVFLEEQQLMNTLQSLKEFYTDPINADNPPPNQLEFRVYHRLIHIRDQKERHDDVPKEILDHPIFRLVTRFRHAVQATSSPITKSSKLRVDEQGMRIFGELVGALMQGNSSSTESNRTSKVMPYLVACILQHLFGSETIDEAEMETIRGGLDVVEIIDGGMSEASEVRGETNGDDDMGEAFMGEVEDEGDQLNEGEEDLYEDQEQEQERHTAVPAFSASQAAAPAPTVGSAFSNLTTTTSTTGGSAFSNLTTAPTNPFGVGFSSPFGGGVFGQPLSTSSSPFGQPASTSSSPFARPAAPPTAPLSTSSPFGQSGASMLPFGQGLGQGLGAPTPAPTSSTSSAFAQPSPFAQPEPKPQVDRIFSTPLTSGAGPFSSSGTGAPSTSITSTVGTNASSGTGSATGSLTPTLNPNAASFTPSSTTGRRSLADAAPLGGISSEPESAFASASASPIPTSAVPLFPSTSGSASPSTSKPSLSIFTSPTATPPAPAASASLTVREEPTLAPPTPGAPRHQPVALPPATPTGMTPTVSFSGLSGFGLPSTPSSSSVSGTTVGIPSSQSAPSGLPFSSSSFPSGSGSTAGFPTSSSSSALPIPPSAASTSTSTPHKDKTHPRLGLLKTSNLPFASTSGSASASESVLSPLQLNSPSLSRMGSLKTFASIGSLGSSSSLGNLGAVSLGALGSGSSGNLEVGSSPLVNGSGSVKGKEKEKAPAGDVSELTEDELTEPETEKPHKVSRGDGERHEEPSKNKAERLYEEAVARGEMYQSRLRKLGKRKERDSHSHTHSHSNSNGVNGITDYDDEGEGEGEYDDAYSESSSISASIRTDSTSPSYLDSHSGRKRARTRHRISGSGSPTRMHTMNGIRKPRPRKRGHGSGATFVTRTDDELARRLRENQASHRARWAPGSFLGVWRGHVGQRAGGKGVGIPPVSLGLSSSSSFFTSSRSFPSSSTSLSALSSSTSLPSPSFPPAQSASASTSSSSVPSLQSTSSLASAQTLWISLNPSSDATAIWVQTKFGVPESGWWRTSASTSTEEGQGGEGIFEIPLVPQAATNVGGEDASANGGLGGGPGIIIFECTPLDGVDDVLERKYHILDDCTRLRDILESLGSSAASSNLSSSTSSSSSSTSHANGTSSVKSSPRFFVPSLVFIHWVEADSEKEQGVPKDLIEMVIDTTSPGAHEPQPLLTSYSILSLTSTTKNLDAKFDQALGELKDMDLEGRLVEVLNLGGTFKLFRPTFDAFVNEWLENCESTSSASLSAYGRGFAYGYGYGYFNASLYAQVLQVSIGLINLATELVEELISCSALSQSVSTKTRRKSKSKSATGEDEDGLLPLPEYPVDEVDDLESLYNTSIPWLAQMITEDNTSSAITTAAASTSMTSNSIIESMIVDLQGHERIGKGFPTKSFIEQLWDLARYCVEAQLPSTSTHTSPSFTKSTFFDTPSSAPGSTSASASTPNGAHNTHIIPTSIIESAQETFQDAIKPHQVSLSHSLNISLRRADMKSKRRSMSDVDTESNASGKRLRLSSGGAFSISTSRSASAVDGLALDDHDSRSMFSVSVTPGQSQSPTPSPDNSMVLSGMSNGVGNGVGSHGTGNNENRDGIWNVNGSGSGMRASSESSEQSSTPTTTTVTVEMLRALTRSMKAKYRDS